jgi:hypothetical protein
MRTFSSLGALLVIASCALVALSVYAGVELATSEARSQVSSASDLDVNHFQRLSYDLRNKPLSEQERDEIANKISSGGMKLYEQYVDKWLTKDAYKRFVGAFFRWPPVGVINPDAEPFFHRLSKHGAGADTVYFLPHTAKGKGGAPCAKADIKEVKSWWSKQPLRVCKASYVPDKIFDDIGYCSGEAEPLMRQPPRPGCGCGPALMGCLPPKGDDPKLDRQVHSSIMTEWFETAARTVAEDRPLDEILTTTRTWQTGLAEFIYLRRDLIALHRKKGWTPKVKKEFDKRLAKVDVYREGRWVNRGKDYMGTGLWWSGLTTHAMKIPVRPAAHAVLETYLCSGFHAANVDADAILEAVNKRDNNLRTLTTFLDAPMRKEDGCKGCHAPMDGAAGYLGEFQGPIFGSFPTRQKTKGEFFVLGAGDFRGKGAGLATLANLVIKQPEYETCAVRRAFEKTLVRPMASGDQPLYQELVKEFKKNGHRYGPIVRRLLLSPAYMNEPARRKAPAREDWKPMDKVPEPVAKVVADVCVECHDSSNVLDLEKLPPPSKVEVWMTILTKVSDSTMPPPEEGNVADRFPIDPSVRSRFVTGVRKMLGPALDKPVPPRRMEHKVWVSVAHMVADEVVGAEKVNGILEPIIQKDGFFAKLPPRGFPPPYTVAIGRASNALCREVAQADASAGGEVYGITAGGDWSKKDKSRAVTALWRAVYQQKPSESELSAAIGLLDEFHQVTEDWKESWAALCSTKLSGPMLFFGAFTE